MERKTMPKEETAGYINSVLDQLDATRMKGLEKAKELQRINQKQMKTELERLTKKYGPKHARVQKMKAKMDFTARMSTVIDIQIKLTKVKIEEFDTDSWRIQGFVYKKDGATPFPNLIVSFAVEKGEGSGRSQFSSYTDDAGFYTITVEKDGVEKLKQAKVFLRVSDNNQRVIYTGKKLLTPDIGIIDMLEDIIIPEKEYGSNM